MDLVPSLVGTSDDSSSNESTGLLTPDSSPLFRPSHPKDTFATRIAQILDDSKPRRREPSTKHADDLVASCDATLPTAGHVSSICVIGAGYVGTLEQHRDAARRLANVISGQQADLLPRS
jgi:hypothetical protein